MYKKLDYEQLLNLKSTFFENLSAVLKKQRMPTLKDYLKQMSKQWDVVYHLAKQEFLWRTVFVKGIDEVIFFDEREKIEIHANKEIIAKMGALVKDSKKIAAQKKSGVSIEQTLMQAFADGNLQDIAGKNYIVYDIETSYATNDLRTAEFYIGYAYVVEHGQGVYKYIDQSNLYKFVEYLVSFDGYVIGYNNIGFDNPVSAYQALRLHGNYTDGEYSRILGILNSKSLDLFQFVRGLTGKRMGLNRLSRALIWLGKTLESGKEAQGLWEAHQEGDQKALKTLKEYCKNDVKMTYLSLWYILYYWKLSLESEEYEYTIDDFVAGANKENQDQWWNEFHKVQSIFSD